MSRIAAPLLHLIQWFRRRSRRFFMVAAAALIVPAVWAYDAWGYRRAVDFEREHAGDPAAVLDAWHRYQSRHPTWRLSLAARGRQQHIQDIEATVRRQELSGSLAEFDDLLADPSADLDRLRQTFRDLCSTFPGAAELNAARGRLAARESRQAYEGLVRQEEEQAAALPALVALA